MWPVRCPGASAAARRRHRWRARAVSGSRHERARTAAPKGAFRSARRDRPQAEGAPVSAQYILQTHALTKEFKGFVAVDKVDLNVRRGTIHALIGPNGAGKTTCFNLLTKFLTPTSGRIVYDGIDITREQPAH